VAQFKFTVLLMPNGPMKITGLPFDPDCYKTEYSIEDEDLKVITYVAALQGICLSQRTWHCFLVYS